MLHLHLRFGSVVLLDMTLFEDTAEPADSEEEEAEPALPFGFVMAERADELPDPVFRDLE